MERMNKKDFEFYRKINKKIKEFVSKEEKKIKNYRELGLFTDAIIRVSLDMQRGLLLNLNEEGRRVAKEVMFNALEKLFKEVEESRND